MNYFRQVPFWKIAILNFVLGLLLPLPILNGLLGLFGIFGEPSAQEMIRGVLFIVVCFIVVFVANLFLWKYGMGKVRHTSSAFPVLKAIGMLAVLFGTILVVFGLLYLANT